MSNGYGVDIYGLATYGYSQPADYSVAPFVAQQTNYGEVTLTWASPNMTAWKLMHLVRSVYGYPSTSTDGILLQEITPGNMVRTYDDPGLTPGTIYYYTMFISLEAPTWNSGSTYNLNSQVLYNGLYWSSIQNSNTNHTPAAGSSFWSASSYIPSWLPAGYTATLALGNQGYTSLLYDRTPQPYKIVTSDTFGNTAVDNKSLRNYLSLFGFGLDTLKASYDSYLNLNDPDTVSATSLDILGRQLGISTNYLSTPQQRRQRVKNAAVNYRMKGQTQSLHNLIAEVTGWDSDITYGPNMFNSPDQTNFPHPMYDLWDQNSTYFVNNLVQFNGYNYKNILQSKGLAQAPTGLNSSNTWWSVQVQNLDTTVNLNPRTGAYSTWSLNPLAGTTVTVPGVLTGLPSPTDATVHNYAALSAVQTAQFLTGAYEQFSESALSTPNYSSGTNYVINNYVLGADGYYYKAVKPSGPGTPYGAVTPGTDNTFWKPFYYTTSDNPNIIKDGIPIPQKPIWSAPTQYFKNDVVQYNGIIYIANIDNINNPPTGYYYSNTPWAFIDVEQTTLVASSYAGRISTSGTNASFTDVLYFYDKDGNLINNSASTYSGYNIGVLGVVARFIQDHTSLGGTTEASLVNAVSESVLTGSTWTTTPATTGIWRASYGMASVDQTLAGTTTYVYTLITPTGSANPGRVGVTFLTDYQDSGHKTHGLIFGYTNSTNFFYATRTTFYSVVAGVETALATWTRLKDGDRMIIDINAAATSVYKYARDGKGSLSNLALNISAGPASVGSVGLIQKYSASGAL